MSLPDKKLSYRELCRHFSWRFDVNKKYIVIAESFSGPLGILLADRFPKSIKQLVLVSTFATAPMPTRLKLFNIINLGAVLFRLPMPRFIARQFFVGNRDSESVIQADLVKRLGTAVRIQCPLTLQSRLALIANVDVTEELSNLQCSLSYVLATEDRLVPRKAFEEIQKIRPNLNVIEIVGPHLIMQTKPVEVWDALVGDSLDDMV
ncbi:MAG: alpha/beta fold hydrolase [Mariniblastus sp.]